MIPQSDMRDVQRAHHADALRRDNRNALLRSYRAIDVDSLPSLAGDRTSGKSRKSHKPTARLSATMPTWNYIVSPRSRFAFFNADGTFDSQSTLVAITAYRMHLASKKGSK